MGCVRRGGEEEGQRRGKGFDDDDDDEHDAPTTNNIKDLDCLSPASCLYVGGWMHGLRTGGLGVVVVVDSQGGKGRLRNEALIADVEPWVHVFASSLHNQTNRPLCEAFPPSQHTTIV